MLIYYYEDEEQKLLKLEEIGYKKYKVVSYDNSNKGDFLPLLDNESLFDDISLPIIILNAEFLKDLEKNKLIVEKILRNSDVKYIFCKSSKKLGVKHFDEEVLKQVNLLNYKNYVKQELKDTQLDDNIANLISQTKDLSKIKNLCSMIKLVSDEISNTEIINYFYHELGDEETIFSLIESLLSGNVTKSLQIIKKISENNIVFLDLLSKEIINLKLIYKLKERNLDLNEISQITNLKPFIITKKINFLTKNKYEEILKIEKNITNYMYNITMSNNIKDDLILKMFIVENG